MMVTFHIYSLFFSATPASATLSLPPQNCSDYITEEVRIWGETFEFMVFCKTDLSLLNGFLVCFILGENVWNNAVETCKTLSLKIFCYFVFDF